ncbi:hypothetical protein [Actinomadura litoris]|uniref:hypothetical protein n=1 Tax=Actinomadura litoris TaxID=2678616 RepID=UPI001FA6CEF3|nr:hypothetical protein [Actinomadura litoris]
MSDWYGEVRGNGFVARRITGLTEYQTRNGCLQEVRADTHGELWLLCDAQSRLAERVGVAESMRRLK